MSNNEPSVLLTPQEVARKLRMDGKRVIMLCRKGAIPCINLKLHDPDRKKNCFRIDSEELEQWIEAGRVKQPQKRTRGKRGRYDHMPAVPSTE